ncbi:ankyrin repeat domain-containing protein [Flammeovirgaceae bacterium SG7u.111]|nr:ankyrin repeat domain-containing protein [Flammeovirgaceae bacterium SG7u.132]WPO37020.1 ankyrin repeat domain-containing protein [Flammeovirgaceae bacterium SG7u.111]
MTPLLLISINGHTSIVKQLLTSGAEADVNKPNLKEKTPLFQAAGRGYLTIVKLLIETGANPNIIDNKGAIPLHRA